MAKTSFVFCFLLVFCASQLYLLKALTHEYHLLDSANLCISRDFVEVHSVINIIICAFLCNRNQRCQAFSLADGPCQLFVFNKCSKSVRDCSCSRRGQVFVKQQPGLEAGALCPSGYGDDLCGVKYKLYSVSSPASMTWRQGRQKCESDGSLAIMADITSTAELQQLDMIYNKYSVGYFLLGGFQHPEAVHPAEGWYWTACNITFNASFWAAGEPDNRADRENALGQYSTTKIADFWEKSTSIRGALCECVSPFD